MNSRRIDLNADLGEAADDDASGLAREQRLLDLVSSVNIACGGHAGDAGSMRRTLGAAGARGLALGAHPSFPDRSGFGRRVLPSQLGQIRSFVGEQLAGLAREAAALGLRLSHVKPHGALYNLAADDLQVADAILDAISAVDARLAVMALAGGALLQRGQERGITTIAEGFVDRGYRSDNGRLLGRDQPGALINDTAQATTQALALASGATMVCPDGGLLRRRVDTLCVHGDGEAAVNLVTAVRTALVGAGFTIGPASC